ALWKGMRAIRTEIIDARAVRFDHAEVHAVLKTPGADALLNKHTVEEGHVGVYFKDGEYVATLGPGTYAFWRDVAKVAVHVHDMRETVLDVTGQDIITQDKVTLRLNAVVTYRVTDALKAIMTVNDVRQSLYREAQLALRAEVGARELDALLADKASLAGAVEAAIRDRATAYGLAVTGFGIRDIVLPGEMRDLMNKVTEARKAAEANFITRREETAAMRSQANTAKMLAENPTLMRLRELEVLEKIAATSKLNVVLGEKGLAERVVNLL
ncbi:MAG: slipin family protein, partial [Candidatus Hydrogenedentes bacterium]|nr:slipin family protein [Candidatus Hydrogenedentota bacterium]